MHLNNALAQSAWPGPTVESGNWRELVAAHLRTVDLERAQKDVAPFLERPHELDLLTLDSLERCLLRPGTK